MKKVIISLIFIVICLLSLTSCNKTNYYDFKFQSGSKDYNATMYYSDDFFNTPSTEYNPSFATASLSVEMSCFASARITDYAKKSKNGSDLLSKMGFSDFYLNDDYQKKPTKDSLGVLICKKTIGDYTLIFVGLRGANYEAEWASNFALGEDTLGYHNGFFNSATKVLSSLNTYLADYRVSGKIKLWTVGYSRAAATNNIASAILCNSIYDNDLSTISNDITLKKEDFYSFCFESPMGVLDNYPVSPHDERYNNIYCIINRNDIVTKVAMRAFGYMRFGTEIYLPDYVTDINYNDVLSNVNRINESLASYKIFGEYKVPSFTTETSNFTSILTGFKYKDYPLSLYLDEFLDALIEQGIGTRSDYYNNIEEGLKYIMETIFKDATPGASFTDIAMALARDAILTDDVSLLMDDVMHNRSKIADDAYPILKKALQKIGVDANMSSVVKCVKSLLNAIGKTAAYDVSLIVPLISKTNIQAVASAHRPEVCLSFLRSFDKIYTDNPYDANYSGKYYLIIQDINEDIAINYNGETIGGIEKYGFIDTTSSNKISIKRDFLTKYTYIYLPINAKYEIKVSNIDSFSVKTYNPSNFSYIETSYEAKLNNDIYTINI